ncbi:hypothetical protein CMUS01_05766 [Colletotrichum musicola]|uniref:Uncharacterized protein n=1 Tax=Colletotrichum musicola TaxID=2175873 RepID=A0A8H6KQI8_9PEZI|nr:hypothetical protein CMUS01_05766 [Colletotrichum musicola]
MAREVMTLPMIRRITSHPSVLGGPLPQLQVACSSQGSREAQQLAEGIAASLDKNATSIRGLPRPQGNGHGLPAGRPVPGPGVLEARELFLAKILAGRFDEPRINDGRLAREILTARPALERSGLTGRVSGLVHLHLPIDGSERRFWPAAISPCLRCVKGTPSRGRHAESVTQDRAAEI